MSRVCEYQRSQLTFNTRAQGFWGERRQDAFFDVRVFNPHASSNRLTSPSACYKKHEKEKRRVYDQRVREMERGTFTPLVLSATGGMGPAAQVFYGRLAALISEKQQQSYSTTMGWIRCCLSFSLLRSAITCLRCSRSSYHHPASPSDLPIDLITWFANVCCPYTGYCLDLPHPCSFLWRGGD